MVILGGLELVVGGYFVHRYHKNKNEKKRLEEEAHQRRHNTFPGAKPPLPSYSYPQQPPAPIPQQKYACYGLQSPPPQPQYQPQPQPYGAPPLPHTQSFTIPRRPVPQHQHSHPPPPQIIQPLQRSDSMATLSRMPIANGYRPSDNNENTPNPPRRYNSNLSPIPQSPMNSPYSHAGFSVSTPALGPTPTTPPYSPVHQQGGRQTVDDNWETYGRQQAGHGGHYAPSVSTALGEHDPPPPYTP